MRKRKDGETELGGAQAETSETPKKAKFRFSAEATDPDELRRSMEVLQGSSSTGTAATATTTVAASANAQSKDGSSNLGDHAHAEIQKLLADGRNIVEVRRLRPRLWNGRPVNVVVYTNECPLTLEAIREDVFAQAGGHEFKVTVRNAETGKMLGSCLIKNHGVFEPKSVPAPSWGAVDPHDVDPKASENEQDAIDKAIESTKRRIDLMNKQAELRSAQQLLARMERGDFDSKDGKDVANDDAISRRIAALEERLKEYWKESEIRNEIRDLKAMLEARQNHMSQHESREVAELREMVDRLQEEIRIARDGAQQANLMTNMLTVMQRNFDTMLQALRSPGGLGDSAGGRARGNFEADLDRIIKLKEVFGQDQGKARQLEDLMYDLALAHLRAGGGGDPTSEDDTVKFAIRELAPVLKEVVQEVLKRRSDNGAQLTKAELQAIYLDEAKKVAAEIRERYRQQEAIAAAVRQQQQQQQPKLPSANPPPTVASVPKLSTPAQQQLQKPKEELQLQAQVNVQASPQMDSGAARPDDRVEPPGPMSPAYDRAKAVNFVLDTLILEIEKGCPAEAYTIGDALNLFDDSLLDGLVGVTNAEELEALLKAYASPGKLDKIKALAAQDPLVRSWLRRVVVTIQEEYQRLLSEGASAEEDNAEAEMQQQEEF